MYKGSETVPGTRCTLQKASCAVVHSNLRSPSSKVQDRQYYLLIPDKALVHALSHDSSGMKGPSYHLRFRPETEVKAELDSSSFSLPAMPHCLSVLSSVLPS